MEPISMGIMAILALLLFIVALVSFRMLTKETNFEDVYGENAMLFFAKEKSSKQKRSTKNKIKTRGNDKKKVDIAGKEHKDKDHLNKHHEAKKTEETLIAGTVKPVEAVVIESVDKMAESVVSVSTKQGKKKNKAKHHTEEPKVEVAVQESEYNPKTESPLTKKKVSGKASPKKAEPVDVPEKKGKKKEQAKELKERPKQTEKPKPEKVIRDVTADELYTRLIAIEDLESEYLSFLATYFSVTGAQMTKQQEEIAALRKQISDRERLVLQCTDKLAAAQKENSDNARVQQSLNAELNKYRLFKRSVHTQLASGLKNETYLQHLIEQLKTEGSAMREELMKAQRAVKSVPRPVDTTAFQQQMDMMRAQLNSSEKKASQLESVLNRRTHELKLMQREFKELRESNYKAVEMSQKQSGKC